ncbi:MAG TPA: serpin family protein [Prolixibacteraceae bacterium]|nr:serpin family protein [Prolixibacteraceae bacterium]HPS13037.1 serpin family protein [Prolixibacteraceae bacterium]
MKTPKFLTLFILVTLLLSCDRISTEKPTEIELDQKSAMVVENNNSFGFRFFENVISSEKTNKNIMVSPLSVSQALSMAINGAGGNTFTQMQQLLGFGDLLLTDLNKSNQTITSSLASHDPKVKFQMANSIWYRNDFSIKAPFLSNNQKYYDAEVSSYDPSKPDKAKDNINNWVDDKTNGKIKQIIDQVNTDDVMFLINAVYFNAKWKTEFKKKNTEPESFTLDDGTQKEVETMIGEVELSYYNKESCSVIKLPYGSGKFDMIVYLPEEGYTTSDIVSEIANTDFDKLSSMTLTKRDLYFPKFEFSYDNELNDELISMGMTDAFSTGLANFSEISDIPLYISKVMHKTFIKTDEEGTEAAAATSITFGYTSAGPSGIIKIDRSFLFAIAEEDTHSILFIGRVYDPSKN